MYYTSKVNYAEYDWTYLIIIVALFIISLLVQHLVKKQYDKYGKVGTISNLTGAEAARKILERNGIVSVQITTHPSEKLSDYYDPKTNTICLSSDAYSNRSIAAIGVACHEAGHAMQAAFSYGPYKLRRACIPMANVCSKAAIPLILAGLILSIFATNLKFLALIGIIMFAVAVFVQFVTLPVEFDASKRALRNIQEEGILTETELIGAKKILTAAAMTYVVSTLVAMVQLLRFISIFSRR